MEKLTQNIIDSARGLELVFGDCFLSLRVINHMNCKEVVSSFALNKNMPKQTREIQFMRCGNNVVAFTTSSEAESLIILPASTPLINTLGEKDTVPTLASLEENQIYTHGSLDKNWF